ncbi:translocation/assembly module TamB domain-containing protein [Roseibium sp.]|uniref:translocation/assembly module TamB domain-containing protein n=5 Tax=Roseibium sp. TaxID=1936156 RepID=UPI003262F54E
MKRLLKGLLWLVLLVALLPVLALAGMQFEAGRTFVSGLISKVASSPEQTIELEDLSLSWSLDAGLGALRISDRNGVWLDANRLDVTWSPLSLLRGRVDIETVHAEAIALLREPVPAPASPDEETDEEEPQSFGRSAPEARLGKLTIDKLVLGTPLLGEELSLTVNGSAEVSNDPLDLAAKLDIQRIDESGGTILADIRFAPDLETLDFDLTVREPREGLVARLLDVQDLPALDLTLTGNGPLDNWAAELALALDGRETVSGKAVLKEAGSNRQLDVDLDGSLAPLMPDLTTAFFIGTTDLKGTAVFDESFQPTSADLTLKTQTLEFAGRGNYDLATETVGASANLKVSAGDGNLIALDLTDRRLAFGPLSVDTQLSGKLENASWTIDVLAQSLSTTEGDIGQTHLKLAGTNAKLTPEQQSSDFTLDLSVDNLRPSDAKLQAISGKSDLSANGAVSASDEQISLQAARLVTPAGTLELASSVFSPDHFDTSGKIGLGNLSMFSALAGQPLAGSLALTFQGKGDPADKKADVDVTANGRNLSLGIAQLDALLRGSTTLTAKAKVDGVDDLELTSLVLKAPGLDTSGTASLDADALSARLTGAFADLSLLNPDVGGTLKFELSGAGPVSSPEISADLSSDNLVLSGTPLEKFKLTAQATASASAPQGSIETSGELNGAPLTLTADLSSANGAATIENLNAAVDGNRITGRFEIADLAKAPDSLSGRLTIDAPTLAALSPLALRPISGALTGDIVVTAADGTTQAVTLDLKGSALSADSLEIGDVTASAKVTTPFGTPRVNGSVLATQIIAGSMPIQSLKLDADNQGSETAFSTAVRLTAGASADGLDASGRIVQADETITLNLNSLDGNYQGLKTSLKEPARVTYAGSAAQIESLILALGSGSLSVTGSAGDQLDIAAELNAVPLALANAFAPGTGLGGTLSGKATAKGPAAEPVADWALTADGLTAAQLSSKGLPALNVASTGTFKNNLVSQKTTVSGAEGLALTADGRIGIERPQSLDIALSGRFPLAFLRRPLTEAGLRAKGSLDLSGSVSGTLASPQYAVTARPNGISLTELTTALTLQDVTGSIDVTPAGITLSSLQAKLSSGGSLSASGTVGLDAGLNANIKAKADQARYIDPGLVTSVVDADITVSGPLSSSSQAALISGLVTIGKADISIPETLPGSVSPVAVRHLNAPKAVREQLVELGVDKQERQTEDTPGLPPKLDVKVSAPGRIFVRGRGLDAELYGDLTIAGTTEDPQAVGAFSLKRGQMDILTRRLAFSKGSATFYGSLTPIIDFLASTTVSSTTVNVGVEGPADDPVISFTSSPDLPQDEVLALLLFGKEMGTLSPSQIAQLAAAIATLTGGNDNGPLAQIRKSLGLDAIDVNTDGDDGPSIGIGKYVNDNIYLGVEQGVGEGGSRVKVDIDLDRGVKVRGEVGADGSSKAGIFFEKEY